MKLQTSVKHVAQLHYRQCTIGECYSQTLKLGMREQTNYFMRTQSGMVNLETGNFVPGDAYLGANSAYAGLTFEHVPHAKFVV